MDDFDHDDASQSSGLKCRQMFNPSEISPLHVFGSDANWIAVNTRIVCKVHLP